MKRTLFPVLSLLLCAAFLLSACAFAKIDPEPTEKDPLVPDETPGQSSGDDETAVFAPLTADVRAELDAIYLQKLAATQAFAAVPAAKGTTWYVSSLNGNDKNAGTSPAAAWKTTANCASNVQKGDTVLFECGSVFRRSGNDNFAVMKNGVTYAAYGEGAKPVFYGSVNASGANNWKQVGGKENLYCFKTPVDPSYDIGTIVFNGGEAWGIKVQMTYLGRKDSNPGRSHQTLPLTDVSNGLQTGLSVAEYDLYTGNDLQGPDLCFYHDSNGKVYLYSEGGNPGTRFSSIELSLPGFAFAGNSGVSDVTILNLDFRNFAGHVVHTFDCKNLTVKNCSFVFVGGTIMSDYGGWRNYDTRLGDAIENWDSCDGMVVENCFFDQVYDTPMTSQSTSAVASKNIAYRNNVVLHTWFGAELWTVNTGVEFCNVEISGNYFGKLGEGFTTTRPDKKDPGEDFMINGFIEIGSKHHAMSDFSVTDNVVDGTVATMLFCLQPQTKNDPNGVLFDRNTYVGTTSVDFARLYERGNASTGYPYTAEGVAAVRELGMEPNGKFYYVVE